MLNPQRHPNQLVSLPTSVALHQVHKAYELADELEEIDIETAKKLRRLADSLLSGLLFDLKSKVARVRQEVRETYLELDQLLDALAE